MSSSLIDLLGSLTDNSVPPPVTVAGGSGGQTVPPPSYLGIVPVDASGIITSYGWPSYDSNNNVLGGYSVANLVPNGNEDMTSNVTANPGTPVPLSTQQISNNTAYGYNSVAMQRSLTVTTAYGSTILYPTQKPDRMSKMSFLPISHLKTFQNPNIYTDVVPYYDFSANYAAGGLGNNLVRNTLYNQQGNAGNTATAEQGFGCLIALPQDSQFTLVASRDKTVRVYTGPLNASSPSSTVVIDSGMSGYSSMVISSLAVCGYAGRTPVGLFTGTYTIAIGLTNTAGAGIVLIYSASFSNGTLHTTTPYTIAPNNATGGFGTSLALNDQYLVVGAPDNNQVCVYQLGALQTTGFALNDGSANNDGNVPSPDGSGNRFSFGSFNSSDTNFGRCVAINAYTQITTSIITDSSGSPAVSTTYNMTVFASSDQAVYTEGSDNTNYNGNNSTIPLANVAELSCDASGGIFSATVRETGASTGAVYVYNLVSGYDSATTPPLAKLTDCTAQVTAHLTVTGNRLVVADNDTLTVYLLDYSNLGNAGPNPYGSHNLPRASPAMSIITRTTLGFNTSVDPTYACTTDYYCRYLLVGTPQAVQNGLSDVGEVMVLNTDPNSTQTYKLSPVAPTPPINANFWYRVQIYDQSGNPIAT